MWRFALSVSLFLGIVVGLVGYGRVLPVYLVVRVLLVVLGTTITIVTATKTVNFLVSEQQSGTASLQDREVDLGEIDNLDNQDESDETDPSGHVKSDERFSDEIDSSTELDDDAEIGELADMVSETMKDEETES